MLYATMMLPFIVAFSAMDGSRLAGSRVGRAAVNMGPVPDVTLDIPDGATYFPPKKMKLAEYAKGKNLIIVGLPGAFTGT